ncbi:MAG TPA: AAA family ATPase [Solirubrobacterales bacterium]|nr:AAA family ATPase [Solirubrobacterales bacterium]
MLFSDVCGFTALGEQLDPESLQQLVGRWFHEAQKVIARHGGTVEKYMGDCVMAVFGVPVVREDDALRAARSALEMHETLVDLNEELAQRWGVRLHVRTGLNTGEAVIGEAPDGERFTVGDAVNVAQRLESAATPGQVLIGEEAARLVSTAAQLDPVEPLDLKGKADPVPAWRLVSVTSELAGPPARAGTPFVGRGEELGQLRRAFDEVVSGHTPRLVTILGPPGIGKSSLASALLSEVEGDATTVVGRCLPYGDGITYWPLAEIIRQLAGGGTTAAVAALVAEGAPGEEDERITSRLARVAGFEPGPVPGEEAQWAVRKLLEKVAGRRPLVVAIEDIHWAEPTFLDLLEHVAAQLTEVPVLLVCQARLELLEERPFWAVIGGERATVMPLEPLPPAEAEELLGRLLNGVDLSAGERAQLLAAAAGNPFFLQQMVAMRVEVGDDAAATVPPTIQAVLTARIDRLPADQRAVVERGSIEGGTFHRGSLVALLPEEARRDLDANLGELLRRELIHRGRPDLEGEEAFRFDHILIRDATYNLLPKHDRADLHEGHARWLEGRAGSGLGEQAELAGYHLEQAFHCHMEVEPAAQESYRQLATGGGRHLGTAGRAALARDDLPAATNLLGRATALLPEDDAAVGDLMPELGLALTEAGRLADAERTLDAAVTQAAARGNAGYKAHAEVVRLTARLQVDTEAGASEVREQFDSLLALFEQDSDDLALGRLWRLRALVHWIEARSSEAEPAWERAAEHARRAGDERGWAESLSWLAASAYVGPTPVEEGIARCESIRAELSDFRRSQALVLQPLAGLRAMRGEFEPARRLLDESSSILTDLGMTMHTAVSHHEAYVAVASGDTDGAATLLSRGYERLEEMGEKALLSTTAAMLADVLIEQGRFEEAWEFTQVAEDTAADDDLSAQVLVRMARARLLAQRGEMPEAKQAGVEAVDLAMRTDWLTDQADALLSQAQVLSAAGDAGAAADACGRAIYLYTRKGNEVGARRAHSLLDKEV